MRIFGVIKEWKIILFVIMLISSLLAIHPFSNTNGVMIQVSRSPAIGLDRGQVITSVNEFIVNNVSDFNQAVNSINPGDIVRINYRVEVFPYVYETRSAYPYIADSINNKTNIGLVVSAVPSSNIKFGLEIEGGIKVLLKPNETLSTVQIENVVEVLGERLNLFGLKEVPINYVQDLSGNQYIRIEFAGSTEEDIKTLLEKQGKFEGRINNLTVFTGDDLLSVCISGGTTCNLMLEPVYVSSQGKQEVAWRFLFQVDLSQRAALAFADMTRNLSIKECTSEGCYLNATLDLYLDDQLIPDGSLMLPSSIQGEVLTKASIVGTRTTKLEAQNEMRRMQAILQSRSIPFKLDIVRVESLSSVKGREFADNIFTVFLFSILLVIIVISIRYRNVKIALPIILIVITEIVSTMGIAVLIGWTLDIPSIAGILASVGTSLDDQIIITDEILSGGSKEESLTVKKKVKKAFTIVMAAFSCTFASMIPLAFAGAGILRGFAITTMIGLTIGVFITRPAYGRICELLIKK